MTNGYTLIELERDVEAIIQELALVRAQKGHDYSGTEDTFTNLRIFGWQGVVVRLGDKFNRLAHFIKSGGELKVLDEKIEDTMQDFINYALFALILYRQEKAKVLETCTQGCKEGFKKAQPKLGPADVIGEDRMVIPPKKTKGIVNWESDIPVEEI